MFKMYMKINIFFALIAMQIEIPAHLTMAMNSREVPESQFDQDDPAARLDEVVRKDTSY
jgi:hypothetical protein